MKNDIHNKDFEIVAKANSKNGLEYHHVSLSIFFFFRCFARNNSAKHEHFFFLILLL